MAYPPSSPAANKADGTATPTDHPAHHNELANDVITIVAELGSGPKGGSADLTARLTALDSTVGGKAATSHSHAESDVTSLVTDLAAKAPLTETVYAGGNSGAAVTLNLANGTIQTFTVSASCTFTMPTATAGKSFTVVLTNNGAFTATFTGVKWAGATAPTLTSGATKLDVFSFMCADGTNWLGFTSGQDLR